MPIPDEAAGGRGSMFDHTYDEFVPFVTALGSSWPAGLRGWCHLDPDFSQLTYGDAGSRAQRICEFIVPGSFIVFWAGMRWLDGPQAGSIVCSVIGFYRVSHVLCAKDVGILDSHRNAHTRRADPQDEEVVVFADPRESGRLRRHIPIGEYTGGAQRVDEEILAEWGDLRRKSGELLKKGYIQRGGNPPIFNDPERFLKWFHRQKPEFVHANNVISGS
ncbi:MAG: hypothetical protein DME50_08300 [Verrucomicrobia bacterium]|nr:MAG: hypothetical protein DME85_12610 [Verrucomicrobiota bacterium]PYK65534.1 MAG: hypothetical protein DME50_08300 [Verrucomicrobiota bacterium]